MAYIGNGPGVASQRIVSTLTATNGQTSFTPTSGYTVGYVDVYLNGVKLISGTDYTASNGTNVVLTSGAATGDTLEVVAYLPRGLSDGYTKAEADARYMDINAVTLPDQTGHNGQFLQSNGTSADWATVDLTQFDAPVQLKNYTTTQRNALTGLDSGDTIYNSTTGSIEFYDGTNWIATNLIPSISSVTGTIYAGAASTLTLSITNATDTVTVRFSEGGSTISDVADVSVSSGSASVTVPAAVYGQTAGDTISVSILNQDGTPSSNGISKTVQGTPTGGSISTTGSYRVHTFTSSGTLTVPSGFSASIDYLIVAGGGAGGSDIGGGGGAGGMLTGTSSISAGTYSATVGAGGASAGAGAAPTSANNGSNSSFGALTVAIGGGSGGTEITGSAVGNGGSGGGAGARSTYGTGTSGQGNNGGTCAGPVSGHGAGGGGGKSAAGDAGNGNVAGDGGAGLQSNIDGNNYYYAGGGGGAVYSGGGTYVGNGGAGGGGGGGNEAGLTSTGGIGRNNGGGGISQNGFNGGANTGGGGGGGSNEDVSGSGGSGIVIVRYQL